MSKLNLRLSHKNNKQKKINNFEVYPINSRYQIPLFNIKKLSRRFCITKKENTYVFFHAQSLEQAQAIFELMRELRFQNNYLAKIFLQPLAAIKIEKLNYFSRPSKVYLIGLKDRVVDDLDLQSIKKRRKEKNRIIGSCIFNLAKLHERQIALGDVSLSNIYKKITDNTAVFGPPAQLRITKSIKDGYHEFALFLCNLKNNGLVRQKELEIYIDHYLKSFENKTEEEKEKQKIINLYKKYYKKYYE
ncbi:MAG: hypothetical protein QXV64_02100 [Candidatus Anstonellaceae archaeon]